MSQSCWRDEGDYRYLDATDRAGIAWEFLRRNADYRATAIAAPMPASECRGTVELLSGARSALGWGLLFRGKPEPPGG